MQNETTNYRPQQSSDEQSVDIKQLIYICLSHWYLFVIGVVVALAAGFIINRYKPNVYQTSGTVLIKNDQGFDPTALMTNLSTGKSNVENEMAILRSYTLTERTVKKMNLEVTYYEKGRFLTSEMYKTAPFDVEFDRSVPQAVGVTYQISNFGEGTMVLHGTSEFLTKYDYVLCQTISSSPYKVDITTECKQGEWIDNGFNRFRIVYNDRFNPETDKTRVLSFRLNSYPGLVNQMSTFTVAATSKQSSVASLVMNGNNPRKIVEFTNLLMTEYVNSGLEKKNSVSENTIQFIDNELAGIQESLSSAESELKDFRTQNDLMNLDLQASQIYNQLQALEKERAELSVNVKIYKRLQDYIKEQINDPENLAAPSTMGITDPLLNRLVTELVTLSQTKATQLLTQTEQHPQIVKLDEQIVTTKRTLLETINNLVSNAELSLDEINKRIAKTMSESKVLPEKQQQLINYQRNFNFNDETYKYLMQRRAEAQILKASNTPDNSILDEARIERVVRISPRTSMNYLIAIILGLLIPALYLFLKDFFNVSINDRKDVEKLTSFPIIGQVAMASGKDPLVVVNSPKSPIAESFRSIRTNIEFLTQGKSKSTILVTGDMQSIGKTFNSINVASIYALYGKKTVLLGFDMRKPKLFKEFGLNNNIGLSSFLSNKESFDSIIQSTSAIPSLDIITSGPIPPNPAELIASDKCQELFDLLKERYDYIIIDTPPVGLVTDAFLLMKHSDVNLFIVRQGVTNKNIFGSIIKDLEKRNLNISLVINGIQTNKGYGYGYGKKYGYGYGYAYGYGYGRYGSNSSGYYGNDYYGEIDEGVKKAKRKDKEKD
ncbi:MAG: polysaccharide biosynthesis tyrosine autokinase [Bacteroidales bacterium]|nr:polysaccharide biosynthesis tyrosine autokinase [Bacteroidales bacterium]